MPVIPLAPSAYKRGESLSPQTELQNLMVESLLGAGDQFELRPRPALLDYGDVDATGVGRGLFARPGVVGTAWGVVGTSLVSFNDFGRDTIRGTVPGTGFVSFAGDETTLVVANDSSAYTYTTAGGFAQITDADLPNIIDCEILNQRLLFIEQTSGRFWWSDILDFDNISATSFATAEGAPDDLLGIERIGSDVYLLGENTVEIWTGSTSAAAPFLRRSGAVVPKGLLATHAKCVADGALWFVSQPEERRVYRMDGASAQRVSNLGVEEALQGATPDSVSMWSQPWLGHEFVFLDTGNETYVYDVNGNYWAEWTSTTSPFLEARFSAYFNDRHVMLTRGGDLRSLSEDSYADSAGATQYRASAYVPHVGRPVRLDSIALRGRSGLSAGSTVALKYSDDQGVTLSTGRDSSFENSHVVWRRMGRLKRPGKLLQFEWSAAVPAAAAAIEINEI